MNDAEQLQDDLTTWLLGNPKTRDIPFTSYKKETIESVNAEDFAGWAQRPGADPSIIGGACLVLPPKLRIKSKNMPGPQFTLTIDVRTFVDPKVSNTGLSALDIATANAAWTHDTLVNRYNRLFCPEDAVTPFFLPGFDAYDTHFEMEMPQDYLGQTAQPVIAVDGATGLVTITCSDAVAAIYYKVGGGIPQPGLEADTYTAPVQAQDGAVIRVTAWNTALMPSVILTATVELT
jgi:hypothetical protein